MFPSSLKKIVVIVCFMAIAITNVWGQQNETEDQAPDIEKLRNWYKIEVLVFIQLIRDQSSQETLTQPDELSYPDAWHWVTTDQELQAFMDSLDVEDMLYEIPTRDQLELIERQFKRDPVLIGAVPEELTRPNIGSDIEINPILQEASNLQNALASLQNEAAQLTEDPPAFVPPKPFHHIADKEQELAKIWQKLRWSRGFRPIWYRSWHQKILPERPDQITSVLIEGPKNAQGEALIQGSLSFWQESYLHTKLDLWMFDYLPNVGQMEAPPIAPELRDPFKAIPSQKERELLFKQVDQSLEQTFELDKEQDSYSAYRFSQHVMSDILLAEDQALAGEQINEISLLSAPTLLLSQPEVRFIPEDLQTDEILIKTQPVYQTTLSSEELLMSKQLEESKKTPTEESLNTETAVYPEEDIASNADFENAQMLALTAPLIESYKKAEFYQLLDQAWVKDKVWALQEKRRVKKGELHYFDHPYFGLILKVTQYEVPEAISNTNAELESATEQ